MSTYPTAEDEKRLLAHAADSTTVVATGNANRPKCKHVCRRRMAGVKSIAHIVAMLAFVAACCIAVLGLSSLAVGTLRHTRAMSCGKHSNGAESAAVTPEVVVAADTEATQATGFSRLLEAVSPESLHDLLHEYLPDTYKHGVYPSEKKAMEAVHRANAALATNIVQLARRDLNGNGTVSSNGSAMPTSSTFKNSSSSAATHSSKTSTTVGTTSSRRTIYTSTVNGTPTVVTATTVVGVGATSTGGASATNSGTLQTGAAVPISSNHKKALALAGAVVGVILI
ncbi:MAG: hypothetical protein SEPTF4163_002589 [Sporothrix epigloea]